MNEWVYKVTWTKWFSRVNSQSTFSGYTIIFITRQRRADLYQRTEQFVTSCFTQMNWRRLKFFEFTGFIIFYKTPPRASLINHNQPRRDLSSNTANNQSPSSFMKSQWVKVGNRPGQVNNSHNSVLWFFFSKTWRWFIDDKKLKKT